jgi:hypothetical protein
MRTTKSVNFCDRTGFEYRAVEGAAAQLGVLLELDPLGQTSVVNSRELLPVTDVHAKPATPWDGADPSRA